MGGSGKENKVICLRLGDPVVLECYAVWTFRRNVVPSSLESSSLSSVHLIENWQTQMRILQLVLESRVLLCILQLVLASRVLLCILQLVLASRVLLCIRGVPGFKCREEALAVLNEVSIIFLSCSKQMLKCTSAVRKVFSHFEYLENRSHGRDVTWQPVRGDLTAHP